VGADEGHHDLHEETENCPVLKFSRRFPLILLVKLRLKKVSKKGKAMGSELCYEQSFSSNKTKMALFLDVYFFTKLQVYVNNIRSILQRKHTDPSITNINFS
jgi:hypothetical protein